MLCHLECSADCLKICGSFVFFFFLKLFYIFNYLFFHPWWEEVEMGKLYEGFPLS